jgi:hypothetical protein
MTVDPTAHPTEFAKWPANCAVAEIEIRPTPFPGGARLASRGNMRLFSSFMGVLLVGCLAGTASAQEELLPVDSVRLVISDDAIERGLADAERDAMVQDRPDSLKNGIIIGAVVGAGLAVLAGNYLCEVFDEGTDAPCWGSILQITALGAGIGAAAGAGIDALAARRTPVPLNPNDRSTPRPRGVIRLRF